MDVPQTFPATIAHTVDASPNLVVSATATNLVVAHATIKVTTEKAVGDRDPLPLKLIVNRHCVVRRQRVRLLLVLAQRRPPWNGSRSVWRTMKSPLLMKGPENLWLQDRHFPGETFPWIFVRPPRRPAVPLCPGIVRLPPLLLLLPLSLPYLDFVCLKVFLM